MKKIRYSILLSMLFTLLMCGSVFASNDDPSLENIVVSTSDLTFNDSKDNTYIVHSNLFVAYARGYSSSYNVFTSADIYSLEPFNVVVNGVNRSANSREYTYAGQPFTLYEWSFGGSVYQYVLSAAFPNRFFNSSLIPNNYQVYTLMNNYSFSESFDPASNSTLEGFNELGFVGGWGSNSLIYNNIDTTSSSSGGGYAGSYSGVQENTFSFQSFDAPIQNGSKAVFRKSLNPSDYDELFIQVSFKGANAMRCSNRDSSISLPATNDRLYIPATINYFNGNSSINYSNADILPLISGTQLTTALSYKHRTWYNDFILGARFVALKDGRYIYGPWTDDKFVIDGDKINTVPEYPENTIKKTKHTVQYNTPTDSPDVDIVVNSNTDEVPVYYPKIKIVEGDVNVEVSIPDINNNLAQAGVNTPSVGIDTGTIQTETQNLIDMANSVPSALAGLFSFLPAWVLGLFAVVFGILLLIRILK